MEEVTKELAEIGKKHGKAFLNETLDVVAIPALKLAAERTPTKIDDLFLESLGAPLKEALKELIAKI